MTVMPAWTIVFFDIAWFFSAARGGMIVLGSLGLVPCSRINVLPAELFAAGPTPGSSTTSVHHEAATGLQTAGKNVVAGSVFEGPAFTPGTLFGVCGHVL